MKDISIIIPAYNAEKSIKKCINSVIKQTKEELEIIVINDGSTDNTEKVIKEIKDERIKYIKQKNHGIGYTRNLGIKKSNSKYIMFLDSDDFLDDEACELLFKIIDKNKLDMLVFDHKKVINKEIIKEKIEDFPNTSLKEMPELLNIINLGPCNKIYKTSLIKDNNIKFVEDLKYEDVPFVIKTLKYSKKIGKLNEYLYYYVINSNSETTVRDERCFDIFKIIEIIRKELKDENLKEELDKLTVRIITNYTIQQRYQKDKKIANKFIDKAFNYLQKEVPDYKNNKYYKNRSFLKKIIEKNKVLTQLYCKLYK